MLCLLLYLRCAFSTNEACQDWFKRLLAKISPLQKIEEVFAFAFHAQCVDNGVTDQCLSDTGSYQLCPLGKLDNKCRYLAHLLPVLACPHWKQRRDCEPVKKIDDVG